MVAKRKPPKNAKRFDSDDPTDVAKWLMQPCPSCGYCPTCGRKNAQPVMPYQPWWPYPWIVTYQPAYIPPTSTTTTVTLTGANTVFPQITAQGETQ